MPERIETTRRCGGCGIAIQTEDAKRPGYVPASAPEREPIICQRCFRIKNYNDASSVAIDQDDFLRLLGGIAQTRSLVVHIVDLFDFEGSLISGLQRFVGNNPVLLVVNKIDLLPRVTNWNRLRNWVQKQASANGLKVADVVLCSARRNIGFERVVQTVGELRGDRDVYVVGATNVGKSTLVNRLISDYSDLHRELTVSRYPGTTLDAVHIPLDDGRSIIDTPGIVYKSRLSEVVPRESLQAVLPEKPLKPMTYQLDARQTLFFGGLVRFDFVEGEHQSFTAYVSGGLPIHRTKLERADELYERHKGEMLSPPSKEGLDSVPPWTRHTLRIRPGADVDVFVSGLGWIQANGKRGSVVDVYAPRGVKVLVRDAML
ncbi:ribosome biogenesis GTPase YqeH [Cohnella zeiphila]|uniref:Ribosome biogenesis GTPase YqeH n=1 Tax=Cohnella zeiphila TaxID=2761120 RepID=A0A7X0SGY4_9BACL|nr:ribosome biogenesis GTPase YqeH [Cohnella zeiphila]